jgi:ABC-type dipeptide/oligopeptide/nickel transport system permease subunit
MTTRGHDIQQEGYWQRIARRFDDNPYGRIALRIIVVLFILAALAPFLANSHALVRFGNDGLEFPIFRSLELIEWRFLIYVPLAGLVYLARNWLLRWPRADLALLLLFLIAAGGVALLLPTHFTLNPAALVTKSQRFALTLSIPRLVWEVLVYGALLVVMARSGRAFFRLPVANFTTVIFAVLLVEVILAHVHPFNDSTTDRDFSGYHVMPPIPYSPNESSPAQFSPPSWDHWCGTDYTGRDIAARMVHGARTSLSIGFVAVSISLLVGVTAGGLAGYYRGWFDIALFRFIEILDCFPPLLLILVFISLSDSQNNMFVIMAVIGLTSWTGLARLVRGEFLRLVGQPFPQAARALGAGDAHIILRHLLPNALGPILVSATFGVASAILIESSLSFLGFGMQAPTSSWGDILSDARLYIDFAWWLAFFPGLAILITIMSYNFVGEALRDAVDPRLKVK